MMDVFKFLDELNVSYLKFDHMPVYTCDESNSLGLDIPGAKTKNLFLRDGKGTRYFLVVTSDEKKIDLKKLSEQLGIRRLSFGSAEKLMTYLNIEPGSVSILSIINDHESLVELVIDEEIWTSSTLHCHPFVNTSTLVISLEDINNILNNLNKSVKILKIT